MFNNGEVVAIYIKNKRGEQEKLTQGGNFKTGHGLIGDIHSKGGNNQVSIFTLEGREKNSSLAHKGLCMERFYENITIKNIDVSRLYIGLRLIIGETIHEITQIGKKCFPECKLIRSGEVCSLAKEVIFTKIIKSGKIKIGDNIIIIQKPS
ncbi:MAG TPA: MOSC domain-containing protein [Tissierellia bacterium]|nr:MOSC domain-containing protein [Tissierellia bacterium]